MQKLCKQLLHGTVRHSINSHLHWAKFCFWELSGIFFLIFLICSWLNPRIWKANCTHDTYYYYKKFKEKKQRRGLLKEKDQKPSQGNNRSYENERPRRWEAEELKPRLATPQEGATAQHPQPAQHPSRLRPAPAGGVTSAGSESPPGSCLRARVVS